MGRRALERDRRFGAARSARDPSDHESDYRTWCVAQRRRNLSRILSSRRVARESPAALAWRRRAFSANGTLRVRPRRGGSGQCATERAPGHLHQFRQSARSVRPRRPGVLRVEKGGTSIEAEIWAMPPEGFGRFVASIPPPLGFGTLSLSDGRHVMGFLVESAATTGAQDISHFGGWRAFLAESAAA